MMGTSIKEVMSSDVRTCEPDATVVDVAKVMAKEDVGPIPVVEGGRLVGLVTDRDLVVRVLAEGKDPGTTQVGEIASRELVTVSPDEDLDQALKLLAQHQVRRLPVVEGDRVVGIVAQADIARLGKDSKTGEVVEEISR
jgi:CBS domain-containing protein